MSSTIQDTVKTLSNLAIQVSDTAPSSADGNPNSLRALLMNTMSWFDEIIYGVGSNENKIIQHYADIKNALHGHCNPGQNQPNKGFIKRLNDAANYLRKTDNSNGRNAIISLQASANTLKKIVKGFRNVLENLGFKEKSLEKFDKFLLSDS